MIFRRQSCFTEWQLALFIVPPPSPRLQKLENEREDRRIQFGLGLGRLRDINHPFWTCGVLATSNHQRPYWGTRGTRSPVNTPCLGASVAKLI